MGAIEKLDGDTVKIVEELELKFKICSIVYKYAHSEEEPTHIIYKYLDNNGEKVLKSAVLLILPHETKDENCKFFS